MFFFKQKTAYEMRISDWSSDVCSSDLPAIAKAHVQQAERPISPCCAAQKIEGWPVCQSRGIDAPKPAKHFPIDWLGQIRRIHLLPFLGADGEIAHHGRENRKRSEEHTSELQSIMRTSYAVFCLKTKTKQQKR